MSFMSYIDLKYKPKNDVVCEFYLESITDAKKAADSIAAESSTGTWTDVATEKPYMKKLGAKVFSIRRKGVGANIRIAYPLELFELGNVPQLMSSIAGNIFGMKSVNKLRLNDVALPREYVNSFKGPRFGIDGVRKLLNVSKRPLLGTIIKPKIGLKTEDHAKVAYDAWVGGCDTVKDDENLSNQKFNPFQRRIKETLIMRNRAEKETGERKIYMPNITAETNEMIRRAKFVKQEGGEYVMIDIITCGWSSLQTLRNAELGLVIHAHRAGHGAFTRGKHGISMLVISKLARLIGVDQLHIGTAAVGKMTQEDDTTELEKALTENCFGLKKVFPVASGGLHAGLIPQLIKKMGKDIIIQAGGGVHGHPEGTIAGAKEMRDAIERAI
jgi:ribulose-bisphosphate carboxylase large chain